MPKGKPPKDKCAHGTPTTGYVRLHLPHCGEDGCFELGVAKFGLRLMTKAEVEKMRVKRAKG